MKKFLSILTLLLVSLLLVGCGEEEKPSNESQFRAYLEANNVMSAAEIDKLVTDELDALPADFFTNVKLPNMKIEMDTASDILYDLDNEDYDELVSLTTTYIWQENQKVYLGLADESNTNFESYYFDLTTLEDMYDMYKENFTQPEVRPSELIAEAIASIFVVTPSVEIDIDEVLNNLKLSYSDFEVVEDGKFKLKNDSLYQKLLYLSGEDVTVEEIKESIESNSIFAIYVYFSDNLVKGFDFTVTYPDENETEALQVKYNYENNELIGLTIKLDSEDMKYEGVITNKDGVLTVKFEQINYYSTQEYKITIDITLSNTKFILKLNDDGSVLYDINLDYNYQKLGNYYDFSLNGYIQVGSEKITITSGNNVVIPSGLKSYPALDGLEYFEG